MRVWQRGFDECYNTTGRYIVKSVEYCRDVAGCAQWVGGVANLWRTAGDVQATWASVIANILTLTLTLTLSAASWQTG